MITCVDLILKIKFPRRFSQGRSFNTRVYSEYIRDTMLKAVPVILSLGYKDRSMGCNINVIVGHNFIRYNTATVTNSFPTLFYMAMACHIQLCEINCTRLLINYFNGTKKLHSANWKYKSKSLDCIGALQKYELLEIEQALLPRCLPNSGQLGKPKRQSRGATRVGEILR